jgi:phosphatidylserine/phosphatidylglycerophosphate/cardiolipin synthase-like enzyme
MNKAFALLLLLVLSACSSLPEKQKQAARVFAEGRKDSSLSCATADHCALASPLHDLAGQTAARSAPDAEQHAVILLDQGHDALLARLHMIESARHSIELQVFIFDLDESGTLILDALVRAARRGVKVRLLLDQLYGLSRPELQARPNSSPASCSSSSTSIRACTPSCCWSTTGWRSSAAAISRTAISTGANPTITVTATSGWPAR